MEKRKAFIPNGSSRNGAFLVLAGVAILGLFLSYFSRGQEKESPIGGTLISVQTHPDAELSRCIGGTPENPAFHSEYEPHGAVNPKDPKNILVSWMTNTSKGSALCRSSVTFDGGKSWSKPYILPALACAGGPSDLFNDDGDPWVSFGPEGRAYISVLTTLMGKEDHAFGLIVFTSPDGGRTWDPPNFVVKYHGLEFSLDNTCVTADPVHPGTAYLLSTRAEVPREVAEAIKKGSEPDSSKIPRPAAMAKTTDGGKTWSELAAISPPKPGIYADDPQMVIDPKAGRLYVFYSEGIEGRAVLFIKSEDGGKTWTEPAVVTDYVPPQMAGRLLKLKQELSFAEEIVHPAIDPKTGRLYVVFTDGRYTKGGMAWVSITSSADGGKTWTKPVPVNDSNVFGTWLPSIALNNDGRVGLTYFETPAAPKGQPIRLPFALMEKTFNLDSKGIIQDVRGRVIDRFDYVPLDVEWTAFMGDYFGLVAIDKVFHAIYVKTVRRAGGVLSSDVFFGF